MRRNRPAVTLSGVTDLRSDIDLGLRMVEGLVRIGEFGSAARVLDELRVITSDSLGQPAPEVAARRRRRAVAGVGVAAAMGLGGLAAAAVGPLVSRNEAPVVRRLDPAVSPALPAPSAVVRPADPSAAAIVTRLDPADGATLTAVERSAPDAEPLPEPDQGVLPTGLPVLPAPDQNLQPPTPGVPGS